MNLSNLMLPKKIYHYFKYDWMRSRVKLNKKHILLTSFPKSASTYISNIISKNFQLKKVILMPGDERREHELDLHYLMKFKNLDYIAQVHLRHSRITESLIKKFNIKPIVLTRNIFDVIISLKDHIRNETEIFPMAFVTKDLAMMDDGDLELAIAQLFTPWYFNFFISWIQYPSKIHITYEDFMLDRDNLFQKIIDYCDLIDPRIDPDNLFFDPTGSKNRFNKGIIGRGDNLDKRAKDYILRISKYYKDYDLTLMGL